MDADFLYLKITQAARQHGLDSGEPDHEVGDLQDALRIVLRHLSKDDLRALEDDPGLQELINPQ